MSDGGTVRLRKPKLDSKPANDVAEVFGFSREDVYVTEMHDELPDDKRMQELRDEITEFGVELGCKVENGDITVEHAHYRMKARVIMMDCGQETTFAQRQELWGIGIRACGTGVVQLARQLAATG